VSLYEAGTKVIILHNWKEHSC